MAFGYYKTFTHNHLQAGSSDSTNFPVTINVTDADLKTVGNSGFVQNSNGYDIRPYSDLALTTPLTFELVYYNASTGQIEMHVNYPTLSTSSDTVYYLAFGDATISTNGSSTSTWDANYEAVYHLADGTTLNINDSTSNGITLTNHGSWGAAAGQIDGGTALSDGTSQYFSTSALVCPDSITFSFWENIATGNAQQDLALGWGHLEANQRLLTHAPYIDNTLYWDYGNATGGSGRISTSYASYYDAWTLVDLTYDNSTGFHGIYLNGSLITSQTAVIANPHVDDRLFYINTDSATSFGKRKFDEIRISNVARSTDYNTAKYNNQKSSSTFLTWGSLTPVGGATDASKFFFFFS